MALGAGSPDTPWCPGTGSCRQKQPYDQWLRFRIVFSTWVWRKFRILTLGARINRYSVMSQLQNRILPTMGIHPDMPWIRRLPILPPLFYPKLVLDPGILFTRNLCYSSCGALTTTFGITHLGNWQYRIYHRCFCWCCHLSSYLDGWTYPQLQSLPGCQHRCRIHSFWMRYAVADGHLLRIQTLICKNPGLPVTRLSQKRKQCTF